MPMSLTFDLEEMDYLGKDTRLTVQGYDRLASVLTKHRIKATFFTTAYFAQQEPALVKRVVEEGHELACHSYQDEDLRPVSDAELKDRLTHATEILTQFYPIEGFRAPHCYYHPRLFPLLKALHYKYDSSLHPAIVPGHYYHPFMPLQPFHQDGILELPISVLPVFRVPISWWWMRNLGSGLTHLGVAWNLLEQRHVVLYFHPWEFADLPSGLPWHIRRKTGVPWLHRLDAFLARLKKNVEIHPLHRLMDQHRYRPLL